MQSSNMEGEYLNLNYIIPTLPPTQSLIQFSTDSITNPTQILFTKFTDLKFPKPPSNKIYLLTQNPFPPSVFAIAFNNFLEALGDSIEIPLNMKELKNEFKLPKKNFPKLSKMIHYFHTEFSNRTRKETRTKWHNYDKQLLFWVVCKYCFLNEKYVVSSLSKKGQRCMDDSDWEEISVILGVETKILKNKWLVMVKPQVKNAPWTQEEDQILKNLIDPNERNHNWTLVATQLEELTHNSSFRNAKQIRERWNNYLNPTLKKSEWEESEDILLLESMLAQGKKWSSISQVMRCRTESQVKNRFNSISNRLKKTYGDHYPEEVLVQMEINSLKGFQNSSFNLTPLPQNAGQVSGSTYHKPYPNENKEQQYSLQQLHQHKEQSKDQIFSSREQFEHQTCHFNQQHNYSHKKYKKNRFSEINSNESLEPEQKKRIKSCQQYNKSMSTADNTRTPSIYSNQSSPDFSKANYFQDGSGLIQRSTTSIQRSALIHQDNITSNLQGNCKVQKIEEGASLISDHLQPEHFPSNNTIQNHIYNNHNNNNNNNNIPVIKQEVQGNFPSGQDIADYQFSSGQNSFADEAQNPQHFQSHMNNYQYIGTVQQPPKILSGSNQCIPPQNGCASNGYLYDGLFPPQPSTGIVGFTHNNCPQGNGLFLEDWGFNPTQNIMPASEYGFPSIPREQPDCTPNNYYSQRTQLSNAFLLEEIPY